MGLINKSRGLCLFFVLGCVSAFQCLKSGRGTEGNVLTAQSWTSAGEMIPGSSQKMQIHLLCLLFSNGNETKELWGHVVYQPWVERSIPHFLLHPYEHVDDFLWHFRISHSAPRPRLEAQIKPGLKTKYFRLSENCGYNIQCLPWVGGLWPFPALQQLPDVLMISQDNFPCRHQSPAGFLTPTLPYSSVVCKPGTMQRVQAD